MTTLYELPYGNTHLQFSLPEGIVADVLLPPSIAPAAFPEEVIRTAMEYPIGGFAWEMLKDLTSAAIAINDKTRPALYAQILPPLLSHLEALGISPENIALIIANGTHAPMQSDEYGRVLPDALLNRYPVYSHDCDDISQLDFLGTTSRFTPVFGNSRFVSADIRIATGNIEPHHFAGFSGGVKSAAIGLAGRETINKNHILLMDDRAMLNSFEDNPLRQDIEEIGALMHVDLAFNTIFNEDKAIVAAFFGQPASVMQSGIPVSRQVCLTSISHKYDMIIASVGGAPKDINFYQSQKAMTHAARLLKPGGTILLAAACPEGVGSQAYINFMHGVSSNDEVLEKTLRIGFSVGPHKALQVAKIAMKARIIIVSEIPAEIIRNLLMESAASLDEAIQMALRRCEASPRVAILPRATNTIPEFE